jgi:hypothetical protein
MRSTHRSIDRPTPRDTKMRARGGCHLSTPRTRRLLAVAEHVNCMCCFRPSPFSERSPLHGLGPPFTSPAGVAVLGWYPRAVICSRVCALANERPAPRLCACVSPPTITALGCVVRVLFCVRVSTLTLPLHFFPPRRCRTERCSTRPHGDAPIHA